MTELRQMFNDGYPLRCAFIDIEGLITPTPGGMLLIDDVLSLAFRLADDFVKLLEDGTGSANDTNFTWTYSDGAYTATMT